MHPTRTRVIPAALPPDARPQDCPGLFSRIPCGIPKTVLLADLNDTSPSLRAYDANDLETEVPLTEAFDTLVSLIGERNFDLCEGLDGKVRKA